MLPSTFEYSEAACFKILTNYKYGKYLPTLNYSSAPNDDMRFTLFILVQHRQIGVIDTKKIMLRHSSKWEELVFVET